MAIIDESLKKDYLENRLDDQIKWYSKKSGTNQKIYKRLQLVMIISAACILFLSGYLSSDQECLKFSIH